MFMNFSNEYEDTPEGPVPNWSVRGHCDVCDDNGYLVASTIPGAPVVCVCHVGSFDNEMELHDVQCDSVPCPFCQLIGTDAA